MTGFPGCKSGATLTLPCSAPCLLAWVQAKGRHPGSCRQLQRHLGRRSKRLLINAWAQTRCHSSTSSSRGLQQLEAGQISCYSHAHLLLRVLPLCFEMGAHPLLSQTCRIARWPGCTAEFFPSSCGRPTLSWHRSPTRCCRSTAVRLMRRGGNIC